MSPGRPSLLRFVAGRIAPVAMASQAFKDPLRPATGTPGDRCLLITVPVGLRSVVPKDFVAPSGQHLIPAC